MKNGLWLGLAIAGVALAAGGSDDVAPASTVKPGRRVELDACLEIAKSEGAIDAAWADFLRVVAWGESNFQSRAMAGIADGAPPWAERNNGPGAAAAASKQYDRKAPEWFRGTPWPRPRYCFGTGGWFAMLPTAALQAFLGTPSILSDPWGVFDPGTSVAMAIAAFRRLQQYNVYKADPKFARLRAGWKATLRMGDEAFLSLRWPRWRAHEIRAGVAPLLLEQRPSELPKVDYVKLARAMGGLPR